MVLLGRVARRPPQRLSSLWSRGRAMAGPSYYKDAVALLNSLQSNASMISQLRERRHSLAKQNKIDSLFYLNALGVTANDLNAMKPVHVTGTKGKGSTCAFVNSILHRAGYKTGFYSSPHLVHVRERIRINGIPLSESAFASYLFHVHDIIKTASVEHNVPLPAYFKFLTLLAFFVFKAEKVEAMVLEVGIGGEHDCTNVIEKPVVCGITVLDLDHTALLGSTLDEIAWHKAGIAKQGSALVTVPQAELAEVVIQKRIEERNAVSEPFVPLDQWKITEKTCERIRSLGLHNEQNLALALCLVKSWLKTTGSHFELSPEVIEEAVLDTNWPGRSQVLVRENVTFYLDGAHTMKSMQSCADWYESRTKAETPSTSLSVLVFQCTADREPCPLLECLLQKAKFDLALFCPTRLEPVVDTANDNTNLNSSYQSQVEKCVQSKLAWKMLTGSENVEVHDCIHSAMERIHGLGHGGIRVLVTGSLHLVGGVLSLEQADTGRV